MRTDSKKYYYDLQLRELEQIKASGKRPTLLMHTCCCVCACWPIRWLSEVFDLTLYYNNDNIYPEAEYEKRYLELVRYVDTFHQESGRQVKIIKTPYRGAEYLKQLEPLKDEPEGGARCLRCYRLRMEAAMRYAVEHHFDWFTSVMTISRQKSSRAINQIGETLDDPACPTRYFFSDFKKDGGQEKSQALVKQYHIYSQNYCGCLYSYQAMRQRTEAKENAAAG